MASGPMRFELMQQRAMKGITLIELMVVVVIVAMLAAIAYPSYRQYAMRSNRTEAKVALMQISQALEKCFTRYMAYDADDCEVGDHFANGGSYDTPDGNYRVTASTLDAQTYTLRAAPLGGQQDDDQCGTLSLDETGTRAETGTGSVQTCW